MKFEEAFTALKNGAKIRCTIWDPGLWIKLDTDRSIIGNTGTSAALDLLADWQVIPEPPKFEAGKYYYTQDGRLAYLRRVDSWPFSVGNCYFAMEGAVRDEAGRWWRHTWYPDGKHSSAARDMTLDLVSAAPSP